VPGKPKQMEKLCLYWEVVKFLFFFHFLEVSHYIDKLAEGVAA